MDACYSDRIAIHSGLVWTGLKSVEPFDINDFIIRIHQNASVLLYGALIEHRGCIILITSYYFEHDTLVTKIGSNDFCAYYCIVN